MGWYSIVEIGGQTMADVWDFDAAVEDDLLLEAKWEIADQSQITEEDVALLSKGERNLPTVATIGETSYTDFGEAIAAANQTGNVTIQLVAETVDVTNSAALNQGTYTITAPMAARM